MSVKWDLTNKMVPYVDSHLIFPLLEFLSFKGLYEETDILRSKLELLKDTNMVDFAMDVHKNLYPDKSVPQYLVERRGSVVTSLKNRLEECQPILDFWKNPEVVSKIDSSRGSRQCIEQLLADYGFNDESLATLFNYAKVEYECGDYSGTSTSLSLYCVLAERTDKNYLDALWGKLASEILMQNWKVAPTDLRKVQQFIDDAAFSSSLEALQQRTWLIHWSLFVFFNTAEGTEAVIDLFLYQKQYLNAIQTTCPWILRYLSAAVIVNRGIKRNVMKDLVKVIQEESYTYQDPVTSFIEDLYVNFDFDGAQQKLRECEDVFSHDFFLVSSLRDFVENSRLMIIETFCRIHQCIRIDRLAEKLNMDTEHAERWIVELIRNSKLDAKIDSQQGHVVMGTQTVSPYQQLIEKTKLLSLRTHVLQLNLEKKQVVQDQPTWGSDGF